MRFENPKLGDKVRVYGGHIGRKESENTITRITNSYVVIHFRYTNGYEKDVLFSKQTGRERGGDDWLMLYAEPLTND